MGLSALCRSSAIKCIAHNVSSDPLFPSPSSSQRLIRWIGCLPSDGPQAEHEISTANPSVLNRSRPHLSPSPGCRNPPERLSLQECPHVTGIMFSRAIKDNSAIRNVLSRLQRGHLVVTNSPATIMSRWLQGERCIPMMRLREQRISINPSLLSMRPRTAGSVPLSRRPSPGRRVRQERLLGGGPARRPS